MTFGRPPLLPNSYMDCELPLDMPLESLTMDSEQRNAHGTGSAVCGAKLFLETSSVLLIFLSSPPSLRIDYALIHACSYPGS